ncbi:hypothetical protein [Nostoc sp. ChiVER01]|uniref:hypothetical protein n=1 Tax=Nostoc sp. ChiVER01 TaxID=3075382 RepID=UPI002AD43697|nr:hypothetical protein [Nostoc sp. ChiVER01]MDZ8227545.1 hypothetical protein [Nostoc sp. ChiVER01]
MKVKQNGSTTEVSGRREECVSEPQRERLGLVSSEGQINGTEQIRIGSQDRPGGNTTRRGEQRDLTTGKILKRLKFIQDEYLSYVRGHQQRLETRLDESKEREAVFLQAIQELEQEVYNLVSEPTEEISEE